MTCFNKQNSIYIELTSTRSIAKPGLALVTYTHFCISTRYWGEKYALFLHINPRQGFFFLKCVTLHLHSSRGSLASSESVHTQRYCRIRSVLSI